MRIVALCEDNDAARKIVSAAIAYDFELLPATKFAEFYDALEHYQGAIGFWQTQDVSFAYSCIRALRSSGVSNLLFMAFPQSDGTEPFPNVKIIESLLRAGADDAQPWPMDVRELVARLKRLLTRENTGFLHNLAFCGCAFNSYTGVVKTAEQSIYLTHMESKVLEVFARNDGRALSQEHIFDVIYDGRGITQIKIVQVFVCKLRKKLELLLDGVDVIENVWGFGYRFNSSGNPARLRAAE